MLALNTQSLQDTPKRDIVEFFSIHFLPQWRWSPRSKTSRAWRTLRRFWRLYGQGIRWSEDKNSTGSTSGLTPQIGNHYFKNCPFSCFNPSFPFGGDLGRVWRHHGGAWWFGHGNPMDTWAVRRSKPNKANVSSLACQVRFSGSLVFDSRSTQR